MTRGCYQANRPWGRAAVGLSLFHTPGDSDAAANQIDTEFEILAGEILNALGVSPSDQEFNYQAFARDPVGYAKHMTQMQTAKEGRPLYAFWATVASPILTAWREFRDNQSGAWTQLWTNWEEYERWLTQLNGLRAAARQAGIELHSQEPIPLEKTLPGEALDAGKKLLGELADIPSDLKNKAGETWQFAKIAAYGALGIGAIFVLSSVVQSVRHGEDPVEKYYKMAQGVRRR